MSPCAWARMTKPRCRGETRWSFSRRLTTRRQELPTVLAWLASSTVINQFLKLAGLHYVHPRGPELSTGRLNPQGYAQSVDKGLLRHCRG